MKLYYLNKGTHEYPKVKHSWKYPAKAFEQGNTLFEDCDHETIKVYETKEEALNALKDYRTSYDNLSSRGINYLLVTEYGIEEWCFKVDEIIKEEEATDEADFLKKVKANPNDFMDFADLSESGSYLGYSIGKVIGYVKVEKSENGRTVTDYIEKEFTNEGDFNAYEQAIEWSDEKHEKLEEVEDLTGIYPIDWNAGF